MEDVFIELFGGFQANLTEAAKRKHIEHTIGWHVCVKQRQCKHHFVCLHVSLVSSVEVCTDCGILRADLGNPE
jgi:hypothetical protein